MSSIFVDWITATLPYTLMGVEPGFMALDSDVEILLGKLGGAAEFKSAVPHLGYAQAWEFGGGAVVQFSTLRADMGVNLTLPGSYLAKNNWRSLLRMCVERGRIARLDVSLDVIDPTFDLRGLYELVDAGQAIIRARSVSFITSKTGQTLYVGKRGNDKMLRIYDKGGESGEAIGEHWRIEAELKGTVAHSAALRLIVNTDEGYGMFRSILECPDHPAYTRAISGSTFLFEFQTNKRRRDTEAWLFGLVARTMAVQEKLNPGTLQAFCETVHKIKI